MTQPDPDALLMAGRIDEAVALLEAAGRGGDARSWLRLAMMRLAGDKIARDLPAARALLKRGREGGDPDAALLEAALMANGTGGTRDWRGAVAILEAAAAKNRLAAEHLAMLRTMDLDADGFPRRLPQLEPLSSTPRVAIAHSFLTPVEAYHIVQAAADIVEPSTVFDPRTGRKIAHPIRTSLNAAIGPTRESLPVQAILRRIAVLSGTAVEQGEPLTLLDYRPGQEYRAHRDFLPPGVANQRIVTVLLYLNEGYRGGETKFLKNGLTVAGRGGDALVFGNTLPDGSPDLDSEHAGLPVLAGQKLLASRWIRALPIDPWTMGGG